MGYDVLPESIAPSASVFCFIFIFNLQRCLSVCYRVARTGGPPGAGIRGAEFRFVSPRRFVRGRAELSFSGTTKGRATAERGGGRRRRMGPLGAAAAVTLAGVLPARLRGGGIPPCLLPNQSSAGVQQWPASFGFASLGFASPRVFPSENDKNLWRSNGETGSDHLTQSLTAMT